MTSESVSGPAGEQEESIPSAMENGLAIGIGHANGHANGHASGTKTTANGLEDKKGGVNGVEDEKPSKSAPSSAKLVRKSLPFWRLYSMADKKDVLLMILGFIGAAVNGATQPANVLFFGSLINVFGTQSNNLDHMQHEVNKLCIIMFLIGVVSWFASILEVSCWTETGERQADRIRSRYLRAVLRQDVGFYDVEASTGDIIQRISSDVMLVQDAMGEKVGSAIHHMSTFLTGFIIGFFYSWRLSLIILAAFPVLILAGKLQTWVLGGLAAKSQAAYARAGSIAEQVLSSVRTVYSFAGEEKAMKEYSESLQEPYIVGLKSGFAKGGGIGLMYASLYCSWALAFWYGGHLIAHGSDDAKHVIIAFFCVIIGGQNLGQSTANFSVFAEGCAAAYKVFEMIKRVPKIDVDNPAGLTPDSVKGNLELKNIRFAYPARPEVPIFQDFSLSIPAGKTVALVGSSGSGKSTVIGLIERFYDPDGGAVVLDGIDLRDLQLRWLRKQIGLVSQEPVLFGTTIAENIAYGVEKSQKVTEEDIMEAARAANAHNFISALPHGYKTQVGERGVQMSGGQKQRIAIARAVLRNPKILLLDEATSALDAESEKIVQEALDRIMVNRTTVIVAHRLSTIRNADMIAVCQQGKLLETGTHSEVMARGEGGAYVQLVKLQESTNEAVEAETKTLKASEKQTPAVQEKAKSKVDGKQTQDVQKVTEESSGPGVSFSRLLKLNAPETPQLLTGLLGAALSGLIAPVYAVILASTIATYYEKDTHKLENKVRDYCIVYIGLAVYSLLVYTIQQGFFGWAGERVTKRVRELTFSAILRQEVGWFDRAENSSGAVLSRLSSDATMVRATLGDRAGVLLQALITLGVGIGIGLYFEWRLALVILALMPFVILTGYVQNAFLKGFSSAAAEQYQKATQVAAEAVGSIRTVAAFSGEDKAMELYCRAGEVPLKTAVRQGRYNSLGLGTSNLMKYGTFALILFYGATLIRKDGVSFTNVIKVFMVLIISSIYAATAASMAPSLAKGTSALVSIFKILDRKPKIDTADSAGRELEHLEGHIELRNIGFHYPARPDTAIFRDFSLVVPAGKTVALVGQSGSGKSTVISLIERFYDPLEGQVLIDGVDIRSLRLKWLRRQVGLVSQEPVLFAGSIKDNITYARPEATMAEVERVARAANAHTFISGLPNGYDTLVGERGVQLSGGQKQRVAIARSMLKDPKILLLDEATSALDAQSERIVQEALDRLMVGRTTIVVAHRLSTVKGADIIAVVQQGSIVEQGSHDELLSNPQGAYTMLVKLQRHTS